ncbi:MAG: ADP-ribosylglycohydrolase family protein [Actinomycetota bacterium]
MDALEPTDNLQRARFALEGLSVGDAFGECFFVDPSVVESLIASRALPEPPWTYTDDTQMALSVYASLREHGCVHQDTLAASFAAKYDNRRGYGPSMHSLLDWIRLGIPWNVAAPKLFGGSGSFGNGAAMRVAPVGAYFAEDLELVVAEAERSATVTHSHPEAIAGAIAVAVAAALSWRLGASRESCVGRDFMDRVLSYVPDSMVAEKIRHGRDLAPGCSVRLAVAALGNGAQISAQDTVPFALWCAAQHLDDYQEALWLTVSGLGDRDTTCAIVGGIVAAHVGAVAIPSEWRQARELLPDWPFGRPSD